MERHRVYCEVTPQEVVFQHGAETHLGLARFGIVLLAAESCDLDNNIGIKETYRPKTLTDKDNRIRMRWRDDLLDFVWLGIGCHVRVVGLLAMQQQIAYRPSYNIELFVLCVKSFRQRDDNILHDEQYIPVSIVLVQCDYCIMAYLCWLVIKSYGSRACELLLALLLKTESESLLRMIGKIAPGGRDLRRAHAMNKGDHEIAYCRHHLG